MVAADGERPNLVAPDNEVGGAGGLSTKEDRRTDLRQKCGRRGAHQS
jgi:hypothetical protein